MNITVFQGGAHLFIAVCTVIAPGFRIYFETNKMPVTTTFCVFSSISGLSQNELDSLSHGSLNYTADEGQDFIPFL